VTNEKKARRNRGAWLGLLVLLLALGGAGYALSSSPSASTGPGKPSAGPSSQVVLAPATSGSNVAGNGNGNGGSGTGNGTGNGGSGTGGNDNCVEPSNGNGNCVKTFGVTVGQTPLLYPSLVRQVPVTYSNPNSFDIEVATYRVSVSVPSSKATVCPASSLQVPSGTVTLNPRPTAPKKATVSTTIPVKLPATAPEGCQGVTFTITVNATAVKK